VINEVFPINAPTSVRVIVLLPNDDELDEQEWLQAASQNEAFGFLGESEEDIYLRTDGKPLD